MQSPNLVYFGILLRGPWVVSISPLLTSKEPVCACVVREVSSRIGNIWSLIFYLGRAQLLPSIVQVISTWCICQQRRDSNHLPQGPIYPLTLILESPLDCKEIQPVYPEGNHSWIFIGRTDTEAETPILGHLMWRTGSLEKTLMLGKIEGGRRRDEMVGWHHDSITWVWVNSGSLWWTGKPSFHGVTKSWTWLSDWTELSQDIRADRS